MKTLFVALLGATFLSGAAMAQSGTNVPVGQSPARTVNQAFFAANTDTAGFNDHAAAVGVAGFGVAQATATILPTNLNVVSCVTGQTALQLPAVQRATPIAILNRGTVACLVFPTVGAALETAAGTLAAVNASFSLAAATDVTFRPVVVAGVTEWLQ